tara:strand:- start:57 stop:257 length:201 start_codon:yes stop_codon:yes gene_type:complete
MLLMLNFEKIMHAQLIMAFVSGFFAIVQIRIFISSFNINNNNNNDDEDGMAYSTRDRYQYSILEAL